MRTETIQVGGMTCGGCVASVTKALKSVQGVSEVAVSLEPGEAKIEFDERTTSSEQLRATVLNAGYKVNTASDKSPTKGGCCN